MMSQSTNRISLGSPSITPGMIVIVRREAFHGSKPHLGASGMSPSGRARNVCFGVPLLRCHVESGNQRTRSAGCPRLERSTKTTYLGSREFIYPRELLIGCH